MRRLFWLAMGITIGALIVRKLTQLAERMAPKHVAGGIGAGLADVAAAVRDFAAEVVEAMHEREAELREATGLDGHLGKAG